MDRSCAVKYLEHVAGELERFPGAKATLEVLAASMAVSFEVSMFKVAVEPWAKSLLSEVKSEAAKRKAYSPTEREDKHE